VLTEVGVVCLRTGMPEAIGTCSLNGNKKRNKEIRGSKVLQLTLRDYHCRT
jgi:hypothetical protein